MMLHDDGILKAISGVGEFLPQSGRRGRDPDAVPARSPLT
jgi:hypothetical protein